MSQQPPLTPPSGGEPVYPAYDAPAWGAASPEQPVVPPPASSYQVPVQYLGGYGVPTHPLATTSLVLAIVGLLSLLLTPFLFVTVVGGLCSPFAIWLGVWARRQIRADPRRHSGEGIATAGFVMGIVGTVLTVIVVALVVALFALIAASFNDI